MAQLQPSRHLTFANPVFEALWFENKDYDYSQFNLYLRRLDKILDTHNPEKVLIILVSPNTVSISSLIRIEELSRYCLDVDNFCTDVHQRTQVLINLLSYAIDFFERKYHTHFLLNEGRVKFHSITQSENNSTSYSEYFFKPFGDYLLTQSAMESFFSQLDLWRPDGIANIVFRTNPSKQTYYLQAYLREKNIPVTIGREINSIVVSAEEQLLFFTDSAIMDKYLFEIYQAFSLMIEQEPDFQKTMTKLDLYDHLNTSLNQLEHEDGENNNPLKI